MLFYIIIHCPHGWLLLRCVSGDLCWVTLNYSYNDSVQEISISAIFTETWWQVCLRAFFLQREVQHLGCTQNLGGQLPIVRGWISWWSLCFFIGFVIIFWCCCIDQVVASEPECLWYNHVKSFTSAHHHCRIMFQKALVVLVAKHENNTKVEVF